MEYERGSEWRRWDLHIHTPETKKNNQFVGTTPSEQWDKFYEDVINYTNSENLTKKVAVIGITDYFSIDNYRKVISDGKLKDIFALILPNIEMRITPVSSESAINIHFICNPNIVSQLDTKLFNQLEYQHSNGITYHATKDDFIKLARLSDSNMPEEQAYKKGLGQFVVDFTNLKAIINKDKELRENTIVIISNKSTDGASGLGNQTCNNANSDLTTLRDDLYYFTDMIFSANKSDADYFLGKRASISKEMIIEKYGKLIPCIHGCDAHTNEKIFNPDNEQYCWIKADCTFEGLKQVIYEPEERVKIQSIYPDNKKDYNIIDKVIINNPDFSTKPLLLNENLTCFIGGKSTGKSIILNNMAKLIDKEQYELKASNNFKISGMKVYWKDGFISDETSEKRNICYIPQTYLNGLTDKPDEQTEIDNIIQSIILQDEQIKEKYKSFNHSIEDIKTELDKEIYDLIKAFTSKLEYEKLLKENGSVEAIDKEILKLQKDRDIIIKSLKIKEEDFSEYEKLKKGVIALMNDIEIKTNDIISINNIQPFVQTQQNIENISTYYSSKINEFFNEKEQLLLSDWDKLKNEIIEILTKDIEKITEEKNKLNESLKEKEILIEKTETLKIIVTKIKDEEKNKKLSEELKNSISLYNSLFNELFNKVIHKIAIFDSLHQDFASFVNKKTNGIDSSMEFIATAQFRFSKFDEKIKSTYDNRKLKSIYNMADDGCANDIDESSLKKLIEPLFAFDGLSYLKNGITIEEALRAVLSNWYNIIYTIKLDNDVIEAMSPGKKALVLLKLLINLAKSDCPILIDQPEDDLDNRSIYDELVKFLKHKKYDRQIIIVTHNANIVLGSDADEIIVANQNGNNSPNESFRFEYRSGSIENNNTIIDIDGNVKKGILNSRGIQDHICEILEGGKEAFNIRKRKYELS